MQLANLFMPTIYEIRRTAQQQQRKEIPYVHSNAIGVCNAICFDRMDWCYLLVSHVAHNWISARNRWVL